MHVDDCYQLGYIIKPHGLKGQVGIFLDVDLPENYKSLESVYVEVNNKLIPYFIDKIVIKKDKAVIKLEEVDDISQAESLKGKPLYLPLSTLPPLKGNKFYYHEVIHFNVVDKINGDLGMVTSIYSFPNQDLLAVDYREKEILIPINDHIIYNIDRVEKIIEVDLPEGLLDIYIDQP